MDKNYILYEKVIDSGTYPMSEDMKTKKLNSKHSIRFSDKSSEKKLSETISTSRVVDRPENINNYLAANITEIVSESKLANLCKR